MNYYENIMIIDPNLNERETEKAVERVKEVISKSGGEILRSENLGIRKLAYNVKKQKKATYILLLFQSPPTAILELERFYKVFDPVLKFIVIKLKKKQTAAALASLEASAKTDIKNIPPGTAKKTEGFSGAESARSEEVK
ncbi:MAG: 30S ribosomal protein S6 [Nitrospirae bacterium]|nr:30S ribosomal protein S6 [Nitrospirota bacterium]